MRRCMGWQKEGALGARDGQQSVSIYAKSKQ
jgi:hypothetical protein